MLPDCPGERQALMAAIHAHLQELNRVVEDALLFRPRRSPGDSLVLRVSGSLLQDFYTGVETILQLASQACGDSPAQRGNGAWLSPGLRETLEAYRAFREVFRNVYGHRLKNRQMELLLNDLPRVYRWFREELEAHLAGIDPEGVSSAPPAAELLAFPVTEEPQPPRPKGAFTTEP